MEYVYIGGFLRIPKYKHCEAVYGHKPKGKPEVMQFANSDARALVETCSLCGAQRQVSAPITSDLTLKVVQ